MRKIFLSKKIIFPVITGCIFLLFLLFSYKDNKKNKVAQNTPDVTITPTPTPIKYTLPNPDFSGLRQTLTPKGEIREIVGNVISYNRETNKIKIGDEAIPFVYDLNISTNEAVIVDEVSVNEKGYAVYTKSDDSNIIPGQTKIIADCPEEKTDPGCQTISNIHIIKEESITKE